MPTPTATSRDPKSPSHVARGRLGARARWGPEPRVLRLDALDGPARRLVLALVDAARREAAGGADPEAPPPT